MEQKGYNAAHWLQQQQNHSLKEPEHSQWQMDAAWHDAVQTAETPAAPLEGRAAGAFIYHNQTI